MKKKLFTALLLLASVSSFANQQDVISADTNDIGLYLTNLLPEGSNMSSCRVTRSEFASTSAQGSPEYIFEVESGTQKVALKIANGGKITTSETEDEDQVTIETKSESIKKGIKTTQELTYTETITQKDGKEEKSMNLAISIKTQKVKGIFRSERANQMHCIVRLNNN